MSEIRLDRVTAGRRSRLRPAVPVGALAAIAAVLLAGCGSSSSGSSSAPVGTAAARASSAEPVDVLYAASLEHVMDTSIGPAFHRATGDSFVGFPAGSSDLASEIKGKVRQGDVFLSASPSVNATLTGAGNGDWVSWYAQFADTTLVLGYNPKSKFAAALRSKPWYEVVTQPGFRLGLTDPKLDPKGVLAVKALHQAARSRDDPALRKLAIDESDYFPEEDLVGRLQSGQLDAGFFYTVEARASHIPTVSLDPIDETAPYTITVLHRAPHQAGAVAFVRFLLGPRGQRLLREAGLTVNSQPSVTGQDVPTGLRSVLGTDR
jgi:molybdate/tungstate transport system substrate-binding protein